MSKDLSINENFYTFEELKDFTNNFTDRTIISLSAFVQTKTNREYSVIKRKLLYDLNKRLFENNIAVIDIQVFLNSVYDKNKDNEHTKDLTTDILRFLNITWSKVTEENHLIVHRWKEQLKEFE